MTHDVCIIGTGRVGLPLALSLIDVGHDVVGVDLDPAIREAVNAGRMPFDEPGYDELIARRALEIHASPEPASRSRAIVITVGTPLHAHIETDLRQITGVLEQLGPHLREGQLLCLRSTVAPGTTRYVRDWIERHTALRVGEDISLAFAPERIAEGKAREELRSLPQILGAEDEGSAEAAEALFGTLAEQCMRTDFVTAELVKLVNNITRYVHFALANQMALVADHFGADIHEIRNLANHEYPRNRVARPGFTAGTCLRKDFGMVNEWSAYPDLLLSAWKVNEYMPAFLVDRLRARFELNGRVVAILGYTFKANTDDTRDSLAPKLWRYLRRALPAEIRVSDRHLPPTIDDEINGPLRNWDEATVLDGADAVFVATNHDRYDDVLREAAARGCDAWIADLWNVAATDRIFYRLSDLAGDP